MVQLLNQPPKQYVVEPGCCLLFAYGSLQPHQKVPKSATHAWPDQVRGLLYDLGPYPAAIQLGTASSFMNGYVLAITQAELTDRLDPFEQVAEGLYRRIEARTRSGFLVWVYEYCRPIPQTAVGPLDRWPPR